MLTPDFDRHVYHLGALEWVRSQILVRVSTRLETMLNQRLFQVAFKQALYTGGPKSDYSAAG